MADEYISRTDAIRICERLRDKNAENDDMSFALNWTAESIFRAPAADVRPVVHGRWEWNSDNGYYYCSKCKAVSPREDQNGEYCDCPAFCHACGADMRGDETAIF